MARAMYEYTVEVLEKVSFNPELFRKELKKAMSRLLPFEIEELVIWVKQLVVRFPELDGYLELVEKQRSSTASRAAALLHRSQSTRAADPQVNT